MGYHQKGLCKGYVLECYIGQNLQKRIHMTLFPFLESFNDMFWVMLDPPWNVLPSARSCVPPSPKTADSPVAAAMATWGSGKTPSRSWGSVKMRRQRRWLVAPLWSPWASSHCDEMWVPSGYVKIAIENGHRNSGFSHEKWWFSHPFLVCLPCRVYGKVPGNTMSSPKGSWPSPLKGFMTYITYRLLYRLYWIE